MAPTHHTGACPLGQGRGKALTGGPRLQCPSLNPFKPVKWFKQCLNLNFVTHLNFDQSKKDLPILKKFEIKYGPEGFEERSNFSYRNFLRFEMDFELKVIEFSMSWNQGKLIWNYWEHGIWWDLANEFLFTPSCEEK
jgi:hypothetical protein